MNRFFFIALFVLALAPRVHAQKTITLSHIGGYQSGIFDGGAAEIAAFDPDSQRLFVTNSASNTIDVLSLEDPHTPSLLFSIDASPHGAKVNSVDVHDGLVAAAIAHEDPLRSGVVAFFDTDGSFITKIKAGPLPDMVTFTPNGRHVLVALEGEPDDDYLNDPRGQIGIIRRPPPQQERRQLSDNKMRIVDFSGFSRRTLDPSIRIFGPDATVAKDLEPEHIAVSDASDVAYVTLQENNALAIIDLRNGGEVVAIKGLGYKDHSLEENALDASDADGVINVANWPVYGMYQPDGIAYYAAPNGRGYLVMANEGDVRDYDGFSEAARIGEMPLDPTAFPNSSDLQEAEHLGHLYATTTLGDTDGDGDFDELYTFGARSFSIRSTMGELMYDSGDDFERIAAELYPDDFNATDTENGSFDSRSDDRGPEPEGIVLGQIGERTYAFIGLERMGGVMVYDITNPNRVRFVEYITTRDFAGDAAAGTAGDLSPEGLVFISEEESPTGMPLLVVSHEVSGSIAVFQVDTVKLTEDIKGEESNRPGDPDSDIEAPASFSLKQNYPNPFNPSTTIQYTLSEEVDVRLSVYNVLGQEIKTLVQGEQSAGEYTASWDGRNQAGQLVPSGTYYYRIEAGEFIETRSMLLTK